MPSPAIDRTPGQWRMLALLAAAVLLGMSLWFTASATASHFQTLWGLDAGQVAGLTTAVQLGFVAGTALVALLNLADLLPSRLLYATSGLLAAGCNLALLAAPTYPSALLLRFLTGLFLAGVYPPAMKMAATWFRAARGLAIGIVVGALTVGKAAPYLVYALADTIDPFLVLTSTSIGAAVAAAVVAVGYREGPHAFPRRPFQWSLVGEVMRHRPTRLAIGGYLGHMWELYAMWSLVGMFFFDYFTRAGDAVMRSTAASGVAAFSVIAIGAAGCVMAGRWADVWGRERITIYAMAVSGACALVMGHLLSAPLWLLAVVASLWGLSIVADSAQFSALVTEVAPAHAVGTALTLQTSMGFLLTAVAIPTTLTLAKSFGWAVAFSLLAVGPAFGIVAMSRLVQARQPAAGRTST